MTAPKATFRCGHPRVGENVEVLAKGGTRCRTCHRATSRIAVARAREDGRPTAERHEGHDVITTGNGRLYCRTCKRGDQVIDEVAVARAVDGEPPERLTTAEREAVVAELSLRGFGPAEIARRVGCHRLTAQKIRERLGLTSARRAAS